MARKIDLPPPPDVQCPVCRGSGINPGKSLSTVVASPRTLDQQRESSGIDSVACPHCNGKGKVHP